MMILVIAKIIDNTSAPTMACAVDTHFFERTKANARITVVQNDPK